MVGGGGILRRGLNNTRDRLVSKKEEQMQRPQGGILARLCGGLPERHSGCCRMTWRVARRCVLGDSVDLGAEGRLYGALWGFMLSAMRSSIRLDPPRSKRQERIKRGE